MTIADEFKCKECNADFETERSLHSHFRKHSLSIPDYYTKHYNRRDLFTDELLPFKNKEQYFERDFVSKVTMKKWLKSQPLDVVRNYCRELLRKRIEKKGLIYALTQVEMRSTMLPPVTFYEEVFGNYEEFCAKLGLKTRFTDTNKYVANTDFIFCDSREQKPLSLNFPIQVKNLPFGDYFCEGSNLYFERKELGDLIGTISQGFDRFVNEVERAQYNNANLIVLIETSLTQSLSFNYLPWLSKKIRATPDFIFSRIRELLQRYPNLQFLFVNGRREAVRVIEGIYSKNLYARDYQLLLDKKML